MSIQKEFRLHSGDPIPFIGYGTYRIRGHLIAEVLDSALYAGYRLIDTAVAYENEEDIGKSLATLLPKHNLSRGDIFITSKLPSSSRGKKELVFETVQSSLNKLQTNYIDLYLIHWPGQQGRSSQHPDNAKVRDETWQALIEAKNKGWLKNIGVSNYTVDHLTELLNNNHGVLPAVNQVEWHPLYHQPELQELCQLNGVFLQAYFSLGGTSDTHELFNEPIVQRVANNLHKSPAQVLLAWAVQQDIGIIPKSLNNAHIIANFNLDLDIPDNELEILNNLPQGRLAGDPTSVL